MPVYITGVGIVSGAGKNVAENLTALRNLKTGIAPSSDYKFHDGSQALTAQVKATNNELKKMLGIAESTPLSRTTLLGAVAAKEAIGNLSAGLLKDVPFISGTTIGGMDISEVFYRNYLKDASQADFTQLLTHDSGDTSERIASILGINGYISTISTACSSAANALMIAGRMLRNSQYKRAIAGGSDALTAFTLNGFNSLMIYDKELCRPFDVSRKGLNLGEGAAYLLLETEESLKETGNKPLAILAGWGNANDAYHQTASSPDGKGATLAIQQALDSAGVKAPQISYVNAHGTGTANNDSSESKALLNIFGDALPPFSSTKAFTGHTLAAAGGIEAVYSVLSIQHKALLPNMHFSTPIEEYGLVPVTKFEEGKNIDFVLSNSFGFGGNNTALVFQKV